jgi:phosphoribosylformylglycinamidine cyclo-ligase
MYATFNMGVGFAVYVRDADATRCVELARAEGYDAWRAGAVFKQADRKAVEIAPIGMTFDADSLQVR